MEMHQVRYFLAAARLLNFTRAAETCHVSQPSLTRAIQKLEEELGGPLFRRERNHTHLTDLGRLMLPHFERTYEAAQAAKALAQSIQKATVAPLHLGVSSMVETDTLDAVLAELADSIPGLALTVSGGSSRELIAMAMNGDLDLLIVEAPADAPERFEAWRLFDQQYRMVVRRDHPLAQRDAVALAEVGDEPWIAHDCEGFGTLQRTAEALSLSLNIKHRAGEVAQLRRLIMAGLGTGFVPPFDAARTASVAIADVEANHDVVLAAIPGRRRSLAADSFVRASRARAWEALSGDL